jgi:hypothetical protein
MSNFCLEVILQRPQKEILFPPSYWINSLDIPFRHKEIWYQNSDLE